MTAVEARRHLQYTFWASRRLLDAVLQLPVEDQQRDLQCSHKGVLETLRHILFADRIWISRVLGTTGEPTGDPIEVEWPQVQQRWQEFAEELTDADLPRPIDYKDMKGNPHQSKLEEIVMHVVNHGTLHRGQVMGMMRQLGAVPPPTDLIFFYREQK